MTDITLSHNVIPHQFHWGVRGNRRHPCCHSACFTIMGISTPIPLCCRRCASTAGLWLEVIGVWDRPQL
jgi:hypothetical protein